jgi:Ca2+-binding EF-hand superfamily protein
MTSDPISDHEMKVIFDEFDLNHDGEITFRGKFSSHTESAFQHAKTAILFMSI